MIKANLATVPHSDKGIKDMRPTFSQHFREQMVLKGIPAENVIAALRDPERVTPVTRYPGQKRYCGYGVAVVLDGDRAITLYLDQVVTPLRPDQMHDKAALNSIRAGIKPGELPLMIESTSPKKSRLTAEKIAELAREDQGIY